MDPSLSLLPDVWYPGCQRLFMRVFRFRSSLAEVNEFLKRQVIQDKSKPTRVAMMIWLRVMVNRTRLCTAVHLARNEIDDQKSRENGLFQYKLYACTIACLSFIFSLIQVSINRSFTNVTRCPLLRNRRKAKNYHIQYLWQKGNRVKLFVNRQEI